jgi:predicted transcriptional regulator
MAHPLKRALICPNPYHGDTIGRMDKDQLRRKRKKLGLTQEELAKRLDMSRPSIARYEGGIKPIPKTVELALKAIEAEERK